MLAFDFFKCVYASLPYVLQPCSAVRLAGLNAGATYIGNYRRRNPGLCA